MRASLPGLQVKLDQVTGMKHSKVPKEESKVMNLVSSMNLGPLFMLYIDFLLVDLMNKYMNMNHQQNLMWKWEYLGQKFR